MSDRLELKQLGTLIARKLGVHTLPVVGKRPSGVESYAELYQRENLAKILEVWEKGWKKATGIALLGESQKEG